MRHSNSIQLPDSMQTSGIPSSMEEGTQSRKMTRCISTTYSTGTGTTSTGKKRGRCTKKTVSFDESVRVRRTLTLDEYTEEETCAAWFGQDEFDLIRRKISMLVRKVEREGLKLGHDKKYCIRGLESLFSKGSERKSETRRKVARVVFFEQEKQRLADCVDEEAIAAACMKISAKSRSLAFNLGGEDRKEANKIYKNNF
ncbi:hypothetical protein IV203_025738 [Nitzschia inconspicua]|uniref:Uncharacterized protein n=1 Tax=Nitzschia inconspicua TaxID=303405 RepID=A0A9K3LHC2_9STRA|nr:hypothetical protein IV203_025738 [Nitzschia inconspicua]